ncbi:hypothetical protein [Kitasatospora sp. NPDC017646]|uniref:hypothetical protein n=1 Tax=Kitasatospora sp. NPDC017646 TaxID=3364024 RepID=UPI003794D3BE
MNRTPTEDPPKIRRHEDRDETPVVVFCGDPDDPDLAEHLAAAVRSRMVVVASRVMEKLLYQAYEDLVPRLRNAKQHGKPKADTKPEESAAEGVEHWKRLCELLRDLSEQGEHRAPMLVFDTQCLVWAASPGRQRRLPTYDRSDPANLLSVVAELDAAVVASESGDGSGAIGHIQAARESILEDAKPIRVSVAAHLLGLSRRTVEAWAEAGLLTATEEPGTTVKVLDPRRLYEVKTLVDDLRAAGKKRGLAEAVWQRLQDQKLLEDDRLQESLGQMRRGEGISLAELRARMEADDEESGADDR